MEKQTTVSSLNFSTWLTPQSVSITQLSGSMVNGSSALNMLNISESDYLTPDITYEIPPSCKPTDFIVSLLFFNDSQIVDFVLLKPFEKTILAVLFPIVSTFGFFGNVAFLTVVALVKEMRTLTNFYLANLAVADLLFIVSFLIHAMASYALSNGVRFMEFERTDVQCGIVYGVVNVSYFSSLTLVTLVTFDRFVAICYPLRHRISNTKKRKITIVTIAWINGTAMSALITPANGSASRVCLIWPPGEPWNQLPNVRYWCLAVDQSFDDIATTLQPLSFIATLVFNFIIFRKIIGCLNNREVATEQADKTRNIVARMLIANGVIFFLCLGPYQLVNLFDFVESRTGISVLDWDQYQALMWFSQSLLLLNSAINPYVYGVTNPKYRKAFICVFICRKSDHSKKASVPSLSRRYATDEIKQKDGRV